MTTKNGKSKRPKKPTTGKYRVVPRDGGLPPIRYVQLVGRIKRSDLRKAIKAVIAEQEAAESTSKES